MFSRRSYRTAAGIAAVAFAFGLSQAVLAQDDEAQQDEAAQEQEPRQEELTFGFGEPASEEQIEDWAIAIPPDGEHLPEGSGTPAEGEEVYMTRCVACHGQNLEGVEELGGNALVGGRDSLDTEDPLRTVESYWPFATTVFDYTRRAMPFDDPGSLSDDEVYAVTAFMLYRGGIIEENQELNAETLPEVEMPNRDGFIPDRRPEPEIRDYK